MTVVVTAEASGCCISGEIDAGSSNKLAEALHRFGRIGRGPTEIDLGGVTFIDASGLRVLVAHSNRLRSRGGVLTIRNASSPVRRLLIITRLADVFGIDDDAPGRAD